MDDYNLIKFYDDNYYPYTYNISEENILLNEGIKRKTISIDYNTYPSLTKHTPIRYSYWKSFIIKHIDPSVRYVDKTKIEGIIFIGFDNLRYYSKDNILYIGCRSKRRLRKLYKYLKRNVNNCHIKYHLSCYLISIIEL